MIKSGDVTFSHIAVHFPDDTAVALYSEGVGQ
jgi:hypothetical protein